MNVLIIITIVVFVFLDMVLMLSYMILKNVGGDHMAIQSGRVGIDSDQVDEFGVLVSDDVTFKDLTQFKIKLETSLLTASNFSDFKEAMSND